MKKIIRISLIMSLIIQVIPCSIFAAEESSFVNYSINGEIVTDIMNAREKNVSVTATVQGEKLMLITAVFTPDNVCNVHFSRINGAYNGTYSIYVPENAAMIKTFVLTDDFSPVDGYYSFLGNDMYEKLSEFEGEYSGVLLWLANLYDSESGGFYATVSGKESPKMFPGLEASAFAVSLLENEYDILREVPENIRQKLLNFFESRYNEETGLYTDTQGETNDRETARIQSSVRSAVLYLKKYGGALVRLMRGASVSMPSYFKTPETYLNWVKGLPWASNPWSAGDRVQASQVYMNYIETSEREEYLNPMFSFIESIQSSKTGFFGNDLLKYNTLSGAYKVMLIYAKHNRALPNAEKIYNSIWDVIDNNNATAAAYVSNSCELLNTMAVSFGCGNRIKEKLKAAYGDIIMNNMLLMKSPDGAFCSTEGEALASFGGVNAGFGIFEGDIDAVSQAFKVRKQLYTQLGFSVPKPPADAEMFWNMLRNPETIPPCKKENLELCYTADFESGVPGNMFLAGNNVETVKDPHNADNSVLCINDESTELAYSAYMKLKTLNGFELSFKAMFREGVNIFSDFGAELNNNYEFDKKYRLLNLLARKNNGSIVLTTNDKIDYEIVRISAMEWVGLKIVGKWDVDEQGIRSFGVSYYVFDKNKGMFIRIPAAENDVYNEISNVRFLRFYSSTTKTGKFYIDDIEYKTTYN